MYAPMDCLMHSISGIELLQILDLKVTGINYGHVYRRKYDVIM